MTKFINVTNRDEFDSFLANLDEAKIIAADTETNGLRYYRDHYMVSMSVYFPEFGIAYNLPFRQGMGDFDVDTGKDFTALSWSTKGKKEMFLAEIYNNVIKRNIKYNNLPEEWLDEIKPLWANVAQVYHNAKFDLHILHQEGFPLSCRVFDTMLGLHVVLEDWYGTKFSAPKNGKKGWERNRDGSLAIRHQYGNRQLKWVAAMLQHTSQIPRDLDATEGEEELLEACQELAKFFATVLCEHQLDHPMISGMLYAGVKSKGLHDSGLYKQQIARVQKKIHIDPKRHLWLLPVEKVAHYAMLDTVLTWDIHEWCLATAARWDNQELYKELCNIQRNVAFPMEVNGAYLDTDEYKKQIREFNERRNEIQDIFDLDVLERGFDPFSIDSYSKLCSWFNSGLLAEDCHHLLEGWHHSGQRLKTYPHAHFSDTRKETLQDHDGHPAVLLVQEYRKIKTSLDFLTKWRDNADANGVVHPSMNVTGTVAGRFSSSGNAGNWQNIPDRRGYNIKKVITVPDENWLICANDYGQLEARIAAWEAETKLREEGVHSYPSTMTNLFNGVYDMGELRKMNPDIKESNFLKNGKVDMHAFTREAIQVRDVVYGNRSDYDILTSLGYDLDTDLDTAGIVADHCRFIAKTLNFGLLYSGTKYMVSKLLRIDLEVADELVIRWRELFPVFEVAQQHYETLALEWRPIPKSHTLSQYVTQRLTGRHRKLARYATQAYKKTGGVSKKFNPKYLAAKKCWNNIVQGTGGMLLPRAYQRYLALSTKSQYVKPFAIIHDAIEYRIHRDYLSEALAVMNHMINIVDINPQLTVDLMCGTNWQELQEVRDVDLWVASRGVEGYAGRN